jgi:hypothetical protein
MMSILPLEDRAYWLFSPAYSSTISPAASHVYNTDRAIGDMVMEVYAIKLRTLKGMN